nr:MAG TPA: hypothetical protein [Caudoviricetes sp.]
MQLRGPPFAHCGPSTEQTRPISAKIRLSCP